MSRWTTDLVVYFLASCGLLAAWFLWDPETSRKNFVIPVILAVSAFLMWLRDKRANRQGKVTVGYPKGVQLNVLVLAALTVLLLLFLVLAFKYLRPVGY